MVIMARSSSKNNWLLMSLAVVTASLMLLQYLIPLNDEMMEQPSNDLVKQSKKEFQRKSPFVLKQSLLSPADAKSGGGGAAAAAVLQNSTYVDNSKKNNPNYHVVFSTSCTDQQHWESMVFFYHVYKVKQPGTVTRIVSGCNANETKEQDEFFNLYIKPMRPNDFHLHHTPDYSRLKLAEGQAYKYMNKPYGLRHWMENNLVLQSVNNEREKTSPFDDDIVILMDPDMILLRPLTHDFTDVENHIWLEQNPSTRIVQHGYPMAQQDGYLTNEWMKFDVAYITNQTMGNYMPMPEWNDGPIHWNTGPPYLATVRDMYKIVVKWTEYVIRVLDVYPHLFGEMFGLIHATVQLKLPFTLVKSIVVSTTTTHNREGWAFIDALPDDQVCSPPYTAKLPIGLHYCKRYSYGKWFFSKYRLKKNIMNCDKNLLLPPPHNLTGVYDYSVPPPRADLKDKGTYVEEHKELYKGAVQGKREYFMLCGMIRSVNEALTHHKKVACGESANLNKIYTVYNDPTNH